MQNLLSKQLMVGLAKQDRRMRRALIDSFLSSQFGKGPVHHRMNHPAFPFQQALPPGFISAGFITCFFFSFLNKSKARLDKKLRTIFPAYKSTACKRLLAASWNVFGDSDGTLVTKHCLVKIVVQQQASKASK